MSTLPPPAATALSTTGAPFAGFWIRVGAALIDGLILLVPNLVIGALFPGEVDAASGRMQSNPIGTLLTLAIGIGYYLYFNAGAWQATPGKRVVGIHIIRTDGAPITYGRALGRYFAQVLSALILLIGYIMVGFTREKTALHDLICDTRVVYGKK